MNRTACLLIVTLAGCSATVVSPSPNDALRRDMQAAVDRSQALERENQELQNKLAAAMAAGSFSPEAIKAMPTVTSLVLNPAPVLEQRPDGCWVVARVETHDGKGRFTQAVGTMGFRVLALTAPAGSQALLAESFAGPLQVRESWRGGVMGTYYSFEIPLLAGAACQGPLSVLVVYEDALTKARIEAVGHTAAQPIQMGK
ncbi:MAG: hypothetical protein ACO3DS_00890 [Phycisphaerales bacterium]|jgi:hypothetical protein